MMSWFCIAKRCHPNIPRRLYQRESWANLPYESVRCKSDEAISDAGLNGATIPGISADGKQGRMKTLRRKHQLKKESKLHRGCMGENYRCAVRLFNVAGLNCSGRGGQRDARKEGVVLRTISWLMKVVGNGVTVRYEGGKRGITWQTNFAHLYLVAWEYSMIGLGTEPREFPFATRITPCSLSINLHYDSEVLPNISM